MCKKCLFQSVEGGEHCAHMIRMIPPPPHFEKWKTLFAGLYIIWIISQKQQQNVWFCCIELNKNNTLKFNINIFSVQFSYNKSVVILFACVFLNYVSLKLS